MNNYTSLQKKFFFYYFQADKEFYRFLDVKNDM